MMPSIDCNPVPDILVTADEKHRHIIGIYRHISTRGAGNVCTTETECKAMINAGVASVASTDVRTRHIGAMACEYRPDLWSFRCDGCITAPWNYTLHHTPLLHWVRRSGMNPSFGFWKMNINEYHAKMRADHELLKISDVPLPSTGYVSVFRQRLHLAGDAGVCRSPSS